MNIIKNITLVEDVTLISLHDSPADPKLLTQIFQMIYDHGVDVDMISQTPTQNNITDLSFTVNDDCLGKILDVSAQLKEAHPEVKMSVRSGNCKLSVFGDEMRGCPGVALRVFKAINDADADINLITTSEVDISVLVASLDVDNIIKNIREEFSK
ncbi:MAG: ACT domain-containing protein [Clostridia bacterium]|nr:ACT domain-containing protein [Clostridia bacterium]